MGLVGVILRLKRAVWFQPADGFLYLRVDFGRWHQAALMLAEMCQQGAETGIRSFLDWDM